MAEKLTVGQKLWYVPDQMVARGAAREVTVEAIGRKWATMDRCNRIDMKTMLADGGGYSSPGRCYPSKEAHEAEVQRERLWSCLRSTICYSNAPDHVTTDAIRQAAALLGIQLPTDTGETP